MMLAAPVCSPIVTAYGYMLIISKMILPLVVVAYIYTVPESPRWLLQKAHSTDNPENKVNYYQRAWSSLCRLRHTKVQAARDIFLLHHVLRNEKKLMQNQQPLVELLTQARSRRALFASIIVMFLQQVSQSSFGF